MLMLSALNLFLVAEGGFEPPTSGLWARRATAALLRDVLLLYHYLIFMQIMSLSS
jgi:hypothetical protein